MPVSKNEQDWAKRETRNEKSGKAVLTKSKRGQHFYFEDHKA
jgi:hypothetical protein